MTKPSKKSRARDRRRPLPVHQPAAPEAKVVNPHKPGWFTQAFFRESVEAVAIAFVLAFLFRTFEAEAFVIPTGSMATTLMGRHKDLTCDECGYHYQVSASGGVDSQTGAIQANSDVVSAACPMCGHEMPTARDRAPAFSGDRILVNKFLYCFEDPQRWDVAVFKYPEEARTNFIKRVAGLPSETLRIHHGDLFVHKDKNDESSLSIASKSPAKLRAMLRVVYDNDYAMAEKLLAYGWPARWQADDPSGGWAAADDHKSFSNKGDSDAESWLRYRHIVPSQQVWQAIGREEALPPDQQPRPRLISDSCAYNSGVEQGGGGSRTRGMGLHWVGDLAVSCTADVRSKQGQLVLELVEGGRRMQCRIDVSTGQAELSISDNPFHAAGTTPLVGPGTHEILFANVDDQLRLWADDRLVQFDRPTTYEPLDNTIPQQSDLAPVGIATVGADVTISHVKVLRDIYYITSKGRHGLIDQRETVICDFKDRHYFRDFSPTSIADFLSNSSLWPEAFSDEDMPPQDFHLDKDQFLMLGDNSAQSKDGRLWEGSEYYVHRELLIGKALFIYWPHSWDKISIFGVEIPFPFFPNFKRMEFVR